MKNSLQKFLGGERHFMNISMRQFALATVTMAVMQAVSAQITMTNVVPMQLPGQGTEIRVMFNGLPPQPQAYQVENPSRLILDFNQAKQSLVQSTIPVSTAEASSVEVASDDQRSRLTVNLNQPGNYTTRVEGNTFILKINNNHVASSLAEIAPVATRPSQGLADIGFQRGGAGEGQVILNLQGANPLWMYSSKAVKWWCAS